MLRAASVGLGWWSDELAGSVQNKSGLIKVVSCYSRSAAKREAFSAKFNTGTHDSYESLLSEPGIDAVLLTTPHSLHAEHVTMAAEAGKHVFVEKPFTLTAESGRAAAAAARSAGKTLAVGHNRRFAAVSGYLRNLVETGEFGILLNLESNYSAPGALGYSQDYWRASRTECPNGGIAPLGVHMIDLLCWLGGPIERVNALATRRAVAIDNDDTTSALFQFSSGPIGYLGCSFASPFNLFLNIYGTKANVFSEVDGNRLRIQRSNGETEAVELTPVNTLRTELDEFALACMGQGEFRVKTEEALLTVAVMEAIKASAASGDSVEVDEEARSAWHESQG